MGGAGAAVTLAALAGHGRGGRCDHRGRGGSGSEMAARLVVAGCGDWPWRRRWCRLPWRQLSQASQRRQEIARAARAGLQGTTGDGRAHPSFCRDR